MENQGGSLPGKRANEFGMVLDIQKGRWNCVHVRRVKKRAVGKPKRRETLRRRRARPRAFKLARTRRTATN